MKLPILFSTEMVRAIMEGRKTVTRRVVKRQHLLVLDSKYHKEHQEVHDKSLITKLCEPPYRPGDILYVRETWCRQPSEEYPFVYRASVKTPDAWKGQWHPSIHMPKEAARIFLRVKDVRVERLQNITVDDALKEGVQEEPPPVCLSEPIYPKNFSEWSKEQKEDWYKSTARANYIGWCDFVDMVFSRFRKIWDSTVRPADLARCGWDANPWVWVIEFERISKEEATK